jgi:hypothetical protein
VYPDPIEEKSSQSANTSDLESKSGIQHHMSF